MPKAGRKLTPQDRLDHLAREFPWLVKGRPGPAVALDRWCGFTRCRGGQRPGGPTYYALAVTTQRMAHGWRRTKPGYFLRRVYLGRDPLVLETVKGWIKRRKRKLRSNNLAMAQLLGSHWRGVLTGNALPTDEWNRKRAADRRAARGAADL